MKKRNTLWTIAIFLLTGVGSYATWINHSMPSLVQTSMRKAATDVTDVTAQYLVNPSFENDQEQSLQVVNNSADGLRGYTLTQPTGWMVEGTAVTQLLVNKDCFTDNNFGKVTTLADGTHAYYLRQGWSGGTTKLQQTIKNLSPGKYKLSVDNRSGYANSATSSFKLMANSNYTSISFTQGSQGFMSSLAWTTTNLVFDVATESDVNIGMEISWVSGGSCVMFDNVRLYRLSDDYVEPAEPTEVDVTSETEGVITNEFVDEPTMKADLLQMLANFATYLKNDFQDCVAPNSIGEICGCFKGENTMGNNEQGVRPNADLGMICAFLVKYGKGKVTLPANVTWNEIEEMAMKSLVFSYSTHKANKLKVCAGNNYWGSVSTSDYAWESSLWAMSVAYSAFFQWDKLSDAQKGYIKAMLKAECNYELNRSIPTGYNGDTKAEENGWEADILAATLGLFPDDALASKWFNRLREFAINSYSHADDAKDNTVIDPEYDNKTVANLYKGQNLYSDYTLQNHNYFHTSYQNVVMQELGEAALALKLFQQGLYGQEKWKTNALMHNNMKVQKEVLNWLALADGELAMPNGNDWSLFLFDQITSFSTNACFLQDADALMLENLAYKFIKARQKTTKDGSWLLRADVGARRMGVEAHRVMMTWLMHEAMSTSSVTPTKWDDFVNKYGDAKVFSTQNVIRAYTKDRFTTFSWSAGLKSYTGYIAANSVDKNKIIVPFRANNTGNIIGWYEVSGKGTNATPVVSGFYDMQGSAYTMNGELNTNDAALNNRFAIYSTPGNAVIYIDYVRANNTGTITAEKGGLTAISVDEFTKTKRTLYIENTHKQLDGSQFTVMESDWINIDNAVGIIGKNNKKMAFGDKANNNSINTAKLYPMYSSTNRSFTAGSVVDRRNLVYYSNITAEQTQAMNEQLQVLTSQLPTGWNGVIAADPDGTNYLLLGNFVSNEKCKLTDIRCAQGAPVFSTETIINDSKSSAEFSANKNRSVSNTIKFFIEGNNVKAKQEEGQTNSISIEALQKTIINVNAVDNGITFSKTVNIDQGNTVKAYIENGELKIQNNNIEEPYTKYLFSYFPSNDNENIYYALSDNGFDYTPMNDGKMIISSDTIAIKKGMRDPHLLRGHDGYFYMVATDMKCAEGWDSNRGMILMKSKDLVNWQHSTVHFPTKYAGKNYANVTRVWAPETIYDPAVGKYMVYFSLLTNDGTIPYDKVYYCYANEDFTDLEGEPTVLYDLGMSTIDMDIVYNDVDGLYHGFFKNEAKGGILKVTSKTLTAPEGTKPGSQWGNLSGRLQQTNVAVEGAGVFQLLDGKTWVLMYDCYGSGYYQFCTSTDLNNFTFKQSTTTSGMFTPRHGSVILVTDKEVETIQNALNEKIIKAASAELLEEIKLAEMLNVDVSEAKRLVSKENATIEELKDMTVQLKMAEFNQVKTIYDEDVTTQFIGKWTESGGTSTNRGQHWDGTNTSSYMEQSGNNWGRSSWNISFQQTVMLPQGNYLLKVAGRSSTDVLASMSFGDVSIDFPHNGDIGYGIDISGNTNFSPEGTYANNNFGRGWEWRYIPFVVEKEGTYDISLNANTNKAHQWVSFGSVSLLRQKSSTNGIFNQKLGLFPNNRQSIYNIQGQAIGNTDQWLTLSSTKKEILIVNHKKYIPIVRR